MAIRRLMAFQYFPHGVRRIVGDPGQAEDVVQEAFLRFRSGTGLSAVFLVGAALVISSGLVATALIHRPAADVSYIVLSARRMA
ncbi:hypothetical protein ACELLULO517_23290 [Acidisoma cellulosilytica]|uniref:Uncharacterized protein n=1 Tax=Acidisoma cellulosilyticum TaxID=2802395 RepID=A0A963Z7D3_9PROT|nr:hypothetical protein [Acidisoma cellulosilyticum]MCB8883193.1 hypothetical protein [Acidisoma cellulosilyticum]